MKIPINIVIYSELDPVQTTSHGRHKGSITHAWKNLWDTQDLVFWRVLKNTETTDCESLGFVLEISDQRKTQAWAKLCISTAKKNKNI